MNRTKSSPAKRLPYGRHQVDDDDIAAVTAVLSSDWLTTGPVTEVFEQALAHAVGARYAVACSSGTAALHLVCLALELQPGDVSIVPSMTFLATANASRFTGAGVVFADCDPRTGLMRTADLKRALTAAGEKASAVFVVHLNGQTAPLKNIAAIARKHGLAVIEDGCHALGTSYRAADGTMQRVGDCRYSDATVFSFHPVKTVAMGEGGAVTTNDAALAERVRLLRNHGMVRDPASFIQHDEAFDDQGRPHPWYYEMQSLGFNYRASDIHCALGLSQLRKLDDVGRARRELMRRYDETLAELAPVVTPVKRVKNCDPVLHLYPVMIDFRAAGTDRATVMRALDEQGIGTQVHYYPVHKQPYYRRLYGDRKLPGAERYYRRVLSLPFFPAMEDSDVDRVISALKETLDL